MSSVHTPWIRTYPKESGKDQEGDGSLCQDGQTCKALSNTRFFVTVISIQGLEVNNLLYHLLYNITMETDSQGLITV